MYYEYDRNARQLSGKHVSNADQPITDSTPPNKAPSRDAQVTARHSRDAGVLIMGRALSTLSDALLPLVIVRLLGKAEVGVLGSVLLVYQTIALFLSSGFPSALMYHMPGRSVSQRRATAVQTATSLFSFGLVGGGVLAATGVFAWLAPDIAARAFSENGPALVHGGLSYLFLLALFPLGDLPARMLPNLLVIEGRADAAARFVVVKSVGNAVFVILPASLGMGIKAVLFSYSIFGLAQGGILWYYLRTIYPGAPREKSSISFIETARFAVPLGLTDIVSSLNNQLDRYLVSAVFPAAVFAEYHVGAFQIPILTTFAYSVGTAYTPLFTELIRGGRAREAIAAWRGTIQKVALIVVPCSAVFAVAAEELICVLFTDQYTRSAGVFRWYALLTAGRVAAFGSVIVAAGKPQLVLRAALFSLGANAIFSALGLYIFGFRGPAIGTCIAFIPMIVVYCRYIAQATGLRFGEIFPFAAYLKVVAVCAAAAIPAVAFKHFAIVPPLVGFIAIAGILLGSFTIIGMVTGLLTREDLRFIVSQFHKRTG